MLDVIGRVRQTSSASGTCGVALIVCVSIVKAKVQITALFMSHGGCFAITNIKIDLDIFWIDGFQHSYWLMSFTFSPALQFFPSSHFLPRERRSTFVFFYPLLLFLLDHEFLIKLNFLKNKLNCIICLNVQREKSVYSDFIFVMNEMYCVLYCVFPVISDICAHKCVHVILKHLYQFYDNVC